MRAGDWIRYQEQMYVVAAVDRDKVYICGPARVALPRKSVVVELVTNDKLHQQLLADIIKFATDKTDPRYILTKELLDART